MDATGTAAGSLADLHARLLACDSSTAVLEAFFHAPVVAHRAPCPPVRLPAALRRVLGVAADEPLRHRRVRLLAGGRPVADADLWYVPARLRPGMDRALCTTTAPFGRVVAPLRPRRQTCRAGIRATGAGATIEHRAILRLEHGEPFALSRERYLPLGPGPTESS